MLSAARLAALAGLLLATAHQQPPSGVSANHPIKSALMVGAGVGWLGWMASRRHGASDTSSPMMGARLQSGIAGVKWGRMASQCRIVFPLSDICANSGADAHVRGRPPGRPLLAPKHPHPQKERDEGVPRRPGGLPHLISAGISPLGKLCGIKL